MQTEKLIQERLRELQKDERLSYPTATIDINAPLALIQLGLETQMKTLKWVLGKDA